MKETTFIQQNKKKWARFEKLSGSSSNDPDEVAELFTEITEDLSYAKTFYPRRSVRVYLNQLAQGVFTSLYKQRKQPLGSFVKFWTESVPLEMYRARFSLLTSFLFVLVAALIGLVSQEYDPGFLRIIVGDGYVDQTLDRIADGDPMGVYGTSESGSMFWMITINNIRVAFIIFALGITFGIFTYFMLLYNGVMLGAFQWFFKANGVLLTSFLAIWIHGAFEISSIIIAGAAGITVGSGLVFPKSFTRIQSLVFSAKRGLLIMLSLIPFFIIAGFLESYVTRHYLSIPDPVKMLLILVCFAIMILYYVVYPFRVARKFPERISLKEVPRFIPARKMEWYKIRNVGEIFTDTFYLFIGRISKLSRIFFTVVFPLALALTITIYSIDSYRFDFSDMDWYENLGTLFGTGRDFSLLKLAGWSFLLALMVCAVHFVLHDDSDEMLIPNFLKYLLKPFIWVYLFAAAVFAILIFSNGFILFLTVFLTPFLLIIPSIVLLEKTNFFTALSRCFSIGNGAYGDGLGSFLLFGLITVIFFFFLQNPIVGFLDLLIMVIKEFVITTTDDYNVVLAFVSSIVYITFIFFMFSICFFSYILCYYTSAEKKTAKSLYERISHFGKRNRTVENALDFE
ncbi:MAG: stage II sporulation protein M [Bacteroidetes bacterium]|nr:stage II sporulation protein M [Bacteroidota bacterium]